MDHDTRLINWNVAGLLQQIWQWLYSFNKK
jgi:hypothetical protein